MHLQVCIAGSRSYFNPAKNSPRYRAQRNIYDIDISQQPPPSDSPRKVDTAQEPFYKIASDSPFYVRGQNGKLQVRCHQLISIPPRIPPLNCGKSRFEYVKGFEQPDSLLPNTWIVVRIDGRGFTKYVQPVFPPLPADDPGLIS